MKVAFKGLIKQLNIKSLVCGEKEAKLTIDFKPTDEIINDLNKLQKPDDLVMIVIMENVETYSKEYLQKLEDI